MFKYERPAFQESTDIMRLVKAELDMYGQELRELSRIWDRDPDTPAPRYKLKKSIEELERKETSLNLMWRKLETVSRTYESAEERILSEAEESSARTLPDDKPDSPDSSRNSRQDQSRNPETWYRRPERIPGFFIPDGVIPINPIRPRPVVPFRPKIFWPHIPIILIIHKEIIRRILRELMRRRLGRGYLQLIIDPKPHVLNISDLKWTAKPTVNNLHVPVCGPYKLPSAEAVNRSRRVFALMKQ